MIKKSLLFTMCAGLFLLLSCQQPSSGSTDSSKSEKKDNETQTEISNDNSGEEETAVSGNPFTGKRYVALSNLFGDYGGYIDFSETEGIFSMEMESPVKISKLEYSCNTATKTITFSHKGIYVLKYNDTQDYAEGDFITGSKNLSKYLTQLLIKSYMHEGTSREKAVEDAIKETKRTFNSNINSEKELSEYFDYVADYLLNTTFTCSYEIGKTSSKKPDRIEFTGHGLYDSKAGVENQKNGIFVSDELEYYFTKSPISDEINTIMEAEIEVSSFSDVTQNAEGKYITSVTIKDDASKTYEAYFQPFDVGTLMGIFLWVFEDLIF